VNKRVFVHVAWVCVLFAGTGIVRAQAPASATAPAGLDSLHDDVLLNELASSGLSDLLERAMDNDRIPEGQRQGLRSLMALRKLSDRNLSTQQRQDLISKVAEGIEAALPGLSDPRTMMQQASALLQYGVERDVNTLEYWGDNPRTQAQLRPVVEAAIKLLDKAASIAQQQADNLSNKITSTNDPRAKAWEQAESFATTAGYTRAMSAYDLALSIDKASPQRKEVAEKAIDFLKQFDTPDSGVQSIVRLRTAKLHLVAGDYPEAKEAFLSVANNVDLSPKASAAQQWEAKYFAALNELLAGNIEPAQKDLDALVPWQQSNLPPDKSTQDGASAADSMLQYRIQSARADAANDPAEKKQANDKAIAMLMDLVKKRPDLQSIIYDQLLSKLPADVDMKTLDPLLLQSFIARADQERIKPEDQSADTIALQKGVDAAKEILRRQKANPGTIDPKFADTDSLLLGFFLQRLKQLAPAAEAMLDYVQSSTDSKNAEIALDNAMSIIGKLRSDPATSDDPATLHAYERFLPIAIDPPYNRKEFAYEYARRLQLDNKPTEALKYFAQVPDTDKRAASARFYEMAAMQQRLDDEKLSPQEHQQIASDLSKRVEQVGKMLKSAISSATSDSEKLRDRSMLARTVLVSADLARREQGNPKRALALLEDFEELARGLPNEKDLTANALYTRVQADMNLGNTASATQTLVALLKSKPGGEGASIVYTLLQRLNEELDRARAAGDQAQMKRLADNRAQLSGFLVDWARNNSDPKIRGYTYRYTVFDAATKHLAAELEPDPATRKAALEAALKLYQKLESPESVKLYQATLEPDSPQRNEPDPAVSLGIGLIAYDLNDFADAQKRLGELLTNRKLGSPQVALTETDGQTKLVFNDQYWEATLKLMRSNLALAASNSTDAAAQEAKQRTVDYLKQLYIQWGRNLGGAKWSPQFEQMRKELIPNFNPDVLPTTAPASTSSADR
jgi:hypothetical protein